jgi:hypothetical protein
MRFSYQLFQKNPRDRSSADRELVGRVDRGKQDAASG